jgi:hypothetical protein
MIDQSGVIKETFRNVDNRIMTLLSHRYLSPIPSSSLHSQHSQSSYLSVSVSLRLCPNVILTGYGYLKVFLAKQVQPPTAEQQSQGLSGMMSKCTIS